jgi:ankyrin repeat protein
MFCYFRTFSNLVNLSQNTKYSIEEINCSSKFIDFIFSHLDVDSLDKVIHILDSSTINDFIDLYEFNVYYDDEKLIQCLFKVIDKVDKIFFDKLLMQSCKYGHFDMTKYLIEGPEGESGAFNGKNIQDRKILRCAAENGHLEIIKYLEGRGFGLHDDDEDLLALAARYDHLEIVKYLIESGADLHKGNYILSLAAGCGHLEIAKYLLEKGVNVHALNDQALTWASSNGRLEIVKYLVKNGADIHALDNYALTISALNGHAEVVKYLENELLNEYIY